jgi:hypothetical protein
VCEKFYWGMLSGAQFRRGPNIERISILANGNRVLLQRCVCFGRETTGVVKP